LSAFQFRNMTVGPGFSGLRNDDVPWKFQTREDGSCPSMNHCLLMRNTGNSPFASSRCTQIKFAHGDPVETKRPHSHESFVTRYRRSPDDEQGG
jgi:hypothetical protein